MRHTGGECPGASPTDPRGSTNDSRWTFGPVDRADATMDGMGWQTLRSVALASYATADGFGPRQNAARHGDGRPRWRTNPVRPFFITPPPRLRWPRGLLAGKWRLVVNLPPPSNRALDTSPLPVEVDGGRKGGSRAHRRKPADGAGAVTIPPHADRRVAHMAAASGQSASLEDPPLLCGPAPSVQKKAGRGRASRAG